MKHINEHFGKHGEFPQGINADEYSNYKPKCSNVDDRFVTVYLGMTVMFNLSSMEVIIISMIIRLSKKTGWCWMGQESFATALNTQTQTIRERFKYLEKRGLIEKNSEKSQYKTSMWRVRKDVSDTYWSLKRQADNSMK